MITQAQKRPWWFRRRPRSTAGALATLVAFLLAGRLAKAQVTNTNLGADYMVQSWQVEDGLPQSSVLDIEQTPDGYLWLATFGGLARFDGVRFTVFDTSNLPGLPTSRLVRLFVDREGALWLITETHDLARLADGRCQPLGSAEGLPPEGVGWVGGGGQGGCWLVGEKHGLWRRENGKFAPVALPPELAEGAMQAILTDGGGRTWFKYQDRVFGFQNGRWDRLPGPKDRPETEAKRVCPSRDGGFWVVTPEGLRKHRQGEWLPEVWPCPEFNRITDALEDHTGSLWVATYGNGLFCFHPTSGWQHLSVESGLTTLSLRSLFCDREGNVWAGTDGGGLLRIKSRSCKMITHREGLGLAAVHSVCQDQQGRIWFAGGTSKPYWLDQGVLSVAIPSPQSDVLDGVWAVLPARDGAMWIGTYGGQVCRYRDGVLTCFGKAEGVRTGTVRALLEDRQGAVWAGGYAGLCRIKAGLVSHYTRRDGLSSEQVWSLAEDSQGNLYVGTRGGGLNRFRDGRFTVFTRKDGLPSDTVNELYMDAEDVLWIGPYTGGLSRFKAGRFFNFAAQAGLPTRELGPILEDGAGFLWMGSGRGILRVSKRELNGFAEGRRRSISYVVSDRNDGLTTLEIGSVQPSGWKARDGTLWFGTGKGAAWVDPKKLHLNPSPPPVVIEEVLLDDKPVRNRGAEGSGPGSVVSDESPEDGGATDRPSAALSSPPALVTVWPRQNRLEFRFTALSFTAPSKVRFRYQLEGLDEHWVEAGAKRVADYTRLPAGRYRFRVTACNDSGVWNETGASLGVVVLSPWYRTWWAYSLGGLLTAGLLVLSYERRLRHVQRAQAAQADFSRRLIASQEQERKRIAAELHDSIGQNLLIIKNRAVLGIQAPAGSPAVTEQLEEVSRAASQAIEEVREISYNLRPYQLDRLGLTQALQNLVKRVAVSAAIPFHTDLDPVDKLFSPEGEINLFRIVQESLSNIVKHSDAATARVTIHHRDRSLRLVIEDDGRGFDCAALTADVQHRHGFGLHGLAERVRILNGRLHYDSPPGHGTRVTVEVPVPPMP